MTRITQLLTLGMALLIGIPCFGVDLIGPFNNTQTVVEYTTFGTTTWLYALNKKDMPVRTDGEFTYFQFGRMIESSGEWSAPIFCTSCRITLNYFRRSVAETEVIDFVFPGRAACSPMSYAA